MTTTSLIDMPPVSPTSGDREQWSAIFVLTGKISDERRREVLKRVSGAFVRDGDGTLLLAIGSRGAMDEALATAAATAKQALSIAGAGVEVAEVRMVAHNDAQRQITDHRPITFYGVTECARSLGVSRQRLRQLADEGKLPDPDATSSGKLMWSADAFELFAAKRSEILSQTPLGRNPWKTQEKKGLGQYRSKFVDDASGTEPPSRQ